MTRADTAPPVPPGTRPPGRDTIRALRALATGLDARQAADLLGLPLAFTTQVAAAAGPFPAAAARAQAAGTGRGNPAITFAFAPASGGWQERALCAQADPEEWFPEKGGSVQRAKRICEACEVRPQCLADALGRGERWGVWGGLSERERRAAGAST
jgi:WhiB family redox-sensing transcriptional regulator